MDIVCRTGWCETCYYQREPKRGTKVALYGSTHQRYFVSQVKGGIHGFTPHIVVFLKSEEGLAVVQMICGICGIEKEKNPDNTYILTVKKESVTCLFLKDYKALLLNPDLGYRVD